MFPDVPAIRVTPVNQAAVRPGGDHVLYWMIGARRTTWSFALQHAVRRARELQRPLLVVEPLRAGYRWASDRLHRFVLDGMADQARAFAAAGVTYLPYVEPEPGAGRGLLAALAARACCVVTDEVPGFFLPRMVAAAGARLDVALEQVDGTGVLPLRAAAIAYPSAAAFRRHLQKTIAPHLSQLPAPAPLARLPAVVRDATIPGAVLRRWPAASAALLAGDAAALARLPIDHDVPPVAFAGGATAAAAAVARFLDDRLDRYGDERDHPDADAASGLSPYLHFGHVAIHEVVRRALEREGWDPSRLADRPTGRRDGFWGAAPATEKFLDEAITWRELGHGFAFHRGDHDRYDGLPAWARASLEAHADDPREHLYDLATLGAAATHDPLWNAAQRQLRVEGRIHNYLRMLWGKQVLAWTPHPRRAFEVLVELNNRWALDGRDANSYSGIGWTLGRFDRPWPERPVFGVVRTMSSARTAKKVELRAWLARFGGDGDGDGATGARDPRQRRLAL
ncbi:MAG: deoxyribodipyrimidine photolyase [Kofleriaceae bacterium]|nr:deoxyribodipyrimidine photolyase [Kofleriaceae bacterium]